MENTQRETRVSAATHANPDGFYRHYVLSALAGVYMLNLLDRGLIGLLLEPIKSDLALSDTQLGFLTGIAFGLFYAVLGLPIARWADRGDRVTIASIAIGLWGLTVMSCLFVTSFPQLVAARIAAAVGEAGCKPPTYSLVGDYFPKAAERTRAMSIYWLGGPFAFLVSYMLGGWLNEQCGWRMTFFLFGIPGLLMAILVKLTIAEPRRPGASDRHEQIYIPSIWEVILTIWRRASCRHLAIALILNFTMIFGLTPWISAFLIRSHGFQTGELGVWLGAIYGGAGVLGVLGGGYFANLLFAGDEKGQMRMSAIALLIATPCFILFLLLPQRLPVMAMLAAWYLVMSFFIAPTYALMQRLVPAAMRATTMAIIMLLYNLIGMGTGPQIVGILSDVFRAAAGAESLRYAMLVMSVLTLWSAYHFWRVGATVGADLAAVDDVASPRRGGTNV